ncbi:hypothetical protein WICMUC_004892 [Wickerhamomyces mucosus]|uniref:SAM-dependent MTase RsmB/NOP-type domain-containing protein n=1 Tax=Wickerhamomyces mucosus TaxID=1378264 RepID=A0A9P8T8J2_9ASCO|nr:hypothetical protein WICMUC_004892 [Wickerhamomyces mucosus]
MSNLYKEAEQFLSSNGKEGSLQNRIFSASKNKRIKTNPKHIFALVLSTLKYKSYLLEIIKKSQLLKLEKQVRETQALLLVHDLLLSKSGRIQMGKTPLKESILKHKTRLTAEFTKLKLKHKVKNLSELIEEDDTPVRWFRVNTIKAKKDDVIEKYFSELEEVTSVDQIELGTIYHDIYVPNLFGVHPKEKITTSIPYQKGQIIIQDRASCFPAYILNPTKNDKIIDACAAPGNKTTHLAAHVQNCPNSINAFERDIRRSKILKTMIDKAGASASVTVNVGDFTQASPSDFEDVTGLVVDPSCSGSGIFGRAYDEENPQEAYSEERLEKLSSFQFSIVKHALSFKNAKKVVYSTCSIHAQENERVVVDLLNDKKVQSLGWRVANRSRVLPNWPRRGFVEEFNTFANPEQIAGGCVRALPKVDGGIGFFAVLFERDSDLSESQSTNNENKVSTNEEDQQNKVTETEDEDIDRDAFEEINDTQDSEDEKYEEWNGFDD